MNINFKSVCVNQNKTFTPSEKHSEANSCNLIESPIQQHYPRELKAQALYQPSFRGRPQEEIPTISKEDFLKDNEGLPVRKALLPVLAETLSEDNGNISQKTVSDFNYFMENKVPILETINVFNEAKEDDNINHKAISVVKKMLEPSKHYDDDYADMLKSLKNSDKNFDDNALNLFLNNSSNLKYYALNYGQYLFPVLKNNNGDYCKESIDFLKKELENPDNEPKKVMSNALSQIRTAKDENGNFSKENLEFDNALSDKFKKEQKYQIKTILKEIDPKDTNLKSDVIKIAESLKDDEDFNPILDFINESQKDKSRNTNISFDEKSVEFTKNILNTNWNKDINTALLITNTINKNSSEYTKDDFASIKRLCSSTDKENIPIFIEAATPKEGEEKGKFNAENLNKYLDIYNARYKNIDIVKNLANTLSKEDNDRALNLFHKLYTLELPTENKYGSSTAKLDPDLLNMYQNLLTLKDRKTGLPKRKCYEPSIQNTENLFKMTLPMESKEAFESFLLCPSFTNIAKMERINFEEVGISPKDTSSYIFQNTSEENLLKLKDFLAKYKKDNNIIDNFDCKTNTNITTNLEISHGRDYDKTTILFDTLKGEPISKIHSKEWNKKEEKSITDYKHNTETNIKYNIVKDDDGEYKEVESQNISVFNKDGSLKETEIMEPSDIPGVFNVKKKYPNGRVDIICDSTINPTNGYKKIIRNLTSLDGTTTKYRYENAPDGDSLLEYQITDKNGKKLMNYSNTFEKISDNHFVSSRNDKKYDIKIKDDKIAIKDLKNKKTAQINLNNFTKGTQKELLPLLKQMPGDELIRLKECGLKNIRYDNSTRAYYSPKEKEICIGSAHQDLAILLHECGHAKDELAFKEISEEINKDTPLRKIYNEEKQNFRNNFSDAQLGLIDYFIGDVHYKGRDNAIIEGLAETNALLNTCPQNNIQSARSLYWQQYFPRTISYLAPLLN